MLFEIWYNKRMKITKLSHAYRFPGFRPLAHVKGIQGEPGAVIVPLKRTYQKKDLSVRIAVPARPVGTITRQSGLEIFPAGDCAYILSLRYGAYDAGSAIW